MEIGGAGVARHCQGAGLADPFDHATSVACEEAQPASMVLPIFCALYYNLLRSLRMWGTKSLSLLSIW